MSVQSAALLFLAASACDEGKPITVGDPPGWYADSGEDCVEGFLDADGDGYAGTAAEVCDGSAILDPEDCDDTDATINPGTHTCGLVGSVSVYAAEAKLIGDAEHGWVGRAMADAGDLDGDGVGDLMLAASGRDGPDGETEAGWVYVVRGPVRGERLLSTAEASIVSETANESLGRSVAGLGDTDGDGYPDVLLGTQWTESTSESTAWLLYGPVPDGQTSAAEGVALTMLQAAMRFIVSEAGDANGDGHLDMLIGAPYASTPADQGGIALLVLGPTDDVDDLETSAEAKVLGESSADELGSALEGGGDQTGDGVPDLLAGAPGIDGDSTVSQAGGIYVLDGPLSGTIAAADADARRLGEGDEIQEAGWDVAFAGDVDADGYDDVLVGAPFGTERAYLLRGPLSGTASLSEATAIFRNTLVIDEDIDEEDAVGHAVSGGQDLDGDGRDDYFITGLNVAHLFYEPVEGVVEVTSSDATLNTGDGGEAGGAGAFELEVVTDADGAGTPGVLVGNYADNTTGSAGGAAWLYLGY